MTFPPLLGDSIDAATMSEWATATHELVEQQRRALEGAAIAYVQARLADETRKLAVQQRRALEDAAITYVQARLAQFEQQVSNMPELKPSSRRSYIQHARAFVRWLSDDFYPGEANRDREKNRRWREDFEKRMNDAGPA